MVAVALESGRAGVIARAEPTRDMKFVVSVSQLTGGGVVGGVFRRIICVSDPWWAGVAARGGCVSRSVRGVAATRKLRDVAKRVALPRFPSFSHR